MSRILNLMLLVFLMCGFLYAQTAAQIDIPLTVSDGTGNVFVLHFGLDPSATDGIDKELGESALVPIPLAGVFDARFNVTTFESTIRDYRTGDASFTGKKIHEIQFQPGKGGTIQLNWNFPATVSGLLEDEITGTLITVSMKDTGSYTPAYPNITKLKLTITYNLTEIPLPTAPLLYSPQNGTEAESVNPTLSWEQVSNASLYELQVAYDSLFSSPVFTDVWLAENSKQLANLFNNTRYFWRVSAKNIAGASSFSPIWSFITESGVPLPTAPVLTYPLNNALGQPLTTSLTWQQVSGATKYHVQIATDINFTNLLSDDASVLQTSFTTPLLQNGMEYFWRVSATNASGQGVYSPIRVFTTLLKSKEAIVSVPLTISDGIAGRQILEFGLDPSASDTLDASLDEISLGPVPPSGMFDCRFILPNSSTSLKDFRSGDALYTGKKSI